MVVVRAGHVGILGVRAVIVRDVVRGCVDRTQQSGAIPGQTGSLGANQQPELVLCAGESVLGGAGIVATGGVIGVGRRSLVVQHPRVPPCRRRVANMATSSDAAPSRSCVPDMHPEVVGQILFGLNGLVDVVEHPRMPPRRRSVPDVSTAWTEPAPASPRGTGVRHVSPE